MCWCSADYVGLFGQSEHFSFLGVNNQSNLSDMRCRTTFYTALGRLLMVDLGMFLSVCVLVKNNLKTYWIDIESHLLKLPHHISVCLLICLLFVCAIMPVCTGEDEDQFEQFMLPLTGAFEAVAQMFSTNTFNEQEAKVSWGQVRVRVVKASHDLSWGSDLSHQCSSQWD